MENLATVELARTTETEYCLAAQRARHNEFWWYFNKTSLYRGSSRPFRDSDGRWWYQVKPRFAWPVDFFTPLERIPTSAGKRGLVGRQWPVPEEQANSRVVFNVITDLAAYSLDSVASNKRRAVRKGLAGLALGVESTGDPRLMIEAREVWNSHVARTGWNRPMQLGEFADSWTELAEWPGTTLVTAREKEDGLLCAWLLVRVIDSTCFIDTLASHTERRSSRPNDAIIFASLVSAAALGIPRAHYSLKSRVKTLEDFKRSVGLSSVGFPACLKLAPGVGPVMRILRPATYSRLTGQDS